MGMKLEGTKELRQALSALERDATKLRAKVVTEMANTAMGVAAKATPVATGHLRRSWAVVSGKFSAGGKACAELQNTAPYASFVNDGHRLGRKGSTQGWSSGYLMLEKGVAAAKKIPALRFEALTGEAKRRYGL